MITKVWTWIKTVVGGFLDNNCSMHAAGLTYFSLLAAVPILCCILVLAKACGADDYARRQINVQIDLMIENIEKGQDEPILGLASTTEEDRTKKRIAAEEFAQRARFVSNSIFERVNQFDLQTFGWIGFGLLLWTVISSLGMVEVSFNEICGVRKARPIWKRACLYPLLLVALPILAAVTMSLPILSLAKDIIVATLGSSWLTQWVSNGLIWFLDSGIFKGLFTLATASLALAFFFWVIPNCRIRFRNAWYGGLMTAVLLGLWMKACAIAQVGIAKSSALYGSFAFFPIVLAWTYINWEIILIGANMVHAFGVVSSEPRAKESA